MRYTTPRAVRYSAVPSASPQAALAGSCVVRMTPRIRYSANWAARQRRAAPRPSFSRISSNFIPTSVRAA